MSFWDNHTILFLFSIENIPRTSMLVFANISGLGILYWLGWFLSPHLTVAILATTWYWNTNPILVIIAWFIAIGGESGEKKLSKKLFIEVVI